MSARFPEMDDEPRCEKAAELPDDGVVRILLRQHARIRALFGEVREAEGARKQDAFNKLRGLLAVQETAEGGLSTGSDPMRRIGSRRYPGELIVVGTRACGGRCAW
ncbi:hypothetical protein [Streptomyces sp. NPDC003393]